MFTLLSNWLFDSSKLVSFVGNLNKYNFNNAKLYLTTCKNLHRGTIFIVNLEIIICIFNHVKYTKIVIIANNCTVKLNRKNVVNPIRIHI
jgi:hypothetical protein